MFLSRSFETGLSHSKWPLLTGLLMNLMALQSGPFREFNAPPWWFFQPTLRRLVGTPVTVLVLSGAKTGANVGADFLRRCITTD